MKVAIFSPYATVVPHFETELDIAQQHLDQGDSVEFFNCLGKLANCDFNLDRRPDRCSECIGRREMGLEMLSPNVRCHSFVEQTNTDVKTKFDSVQDLIDYRIDDFDIGYAALSSVVSVCRDPEPDLVENHDILKRFLTSAWQTYHQTIEHLSNNQVDRVYVFNGRFAAMRAVLRACQRQNVSCFLHERGCDGKHYDLFENHLPHDITKMKLVIEQLWQNAAANPEREKIASQWFHDRVNRVEKSWHSFVKDQKRGRLPSGFDRTRKNISIFCSSDDEFVAIGDEWKNPIYPNQVSAISRIAADLETSETQTHLYVRVHPSQKNVDNRRLREMLTISFANVTIIPPEAEIDTYALVKSSDTIVSFGSSVGIEAVFWDKPSVLLGPCFYRELGGVYPATTHEETIKLLTSPLAPQEKLGALKFGFWFQTRGYSHQYFESSDLFEGQFKGQTLYAQPQKPPTVLRSFKATVRRAMQQLSKVFG